jgi:acyl-CoA hydrolase
VNRYEMMYQEKLMTVDEAVSLLRDNDVVTFSQSANEPITFLENIHKAAERVNNLCLNYNLDQGYYPFFAPEYRGKIDVTSAFLMASGRKAWAEGGINYMPGHLHNTGPRFLSGHKVSVLVLAVTPMDRHGYFRFSLDNVFEHDWLESADRVILEVNPQIPVVYGENEIHISDVAAVYESDHPIPTLASPEPGEVESQIGAHVASLVQDGDTIQLGIGMIPNAVAQSLKGKKDLGIHTEMITSSVVDLVEWGVVTGKRKTLHKGRIIGAFALGDQRLYDFMAHNPSVMMMPGRYVNNPWVVAQNDNMVSINTCLAVDFYGQVCSESIGPRPYSGSGGQNDTAEGAIHAKGGRSIIALRSTAKNGAISTITPCLAPGSVVTLSANNIDYIVTEYGVARMKGQTLRQRAENLIAVAHPDFREELTRQAKEMGRI